MKKGTKLGLGAFALLLGSIVLSGCTASFCNTKDKAHMLYAYDYGVTTYYNDDDGGKRTLLTLDDTEANALITSPIYVEVSYDDAYAINEIDKAATTVSKKHPYAFATPTLNYWSEMDKLVLTNALKEAKANDPTFTVKDALDITRGWDYEEGTKKGALDTYGYLKFYDSVDGKSLWANWSTLDAKIRESGKVSLDECPSSDYVALYKSTMNKFIDANRSCIAINDGDYGYYGPHNQPIEVSGKTWASAFSKTNFLWFEGILVYPLAAFSDVLTTGFLKANVANGVAQFLAILVVTFVVRGLMLLVTWNQSKTTAKMNALQPELTKIQNKYPNANTNQYEKQRMAAEQAALYKKHKINPLATFLFLFIQFPVFMCVWSALQGSAALSSGAFLNLNFSQPINAILFNASEWNIANGGGALTALILFLIMSATQVVSMLLPQWIQKSKAKKVARLGKNPAKKEQDNKMKWVMYIMCAVIVFMGFTLASGMALYWIGSALFGIAQTLLMEKLNSRAKK